MSIPGNLTPLFNSGSSAAAAGYQVSRSLRFNSADSAYLSRTPGTAGNRQTWTWAGWVKRSAVSSGNQRFFGIFQGGVVQEFFVFNSGDTLRIAVIQETKGFTTTQVFRDPSAWYHIVVVLDTPQATASDRLKLYVNGTQVTTFSSTDYPVQNSTGDINNTYPHFISNGGNGEYFNGYLADIHFIDGQALTPSSFTEVSATTGQLIPKTYTGSFGTNGFWLKFSDNSAATAATLGKDYSGNSNNWTPNNFSVATTGVNYTAGSTFPADAVNTAGLFSGSSSNYTNFGSGGASPSGTTRTFSFTNLPTVTSLLRLKVYNGEGAGSTIKVNGGTAQTVPYNYPSGGYFTFTGVTTVSSITYTYGGGNLDQAALMVIEIDGTNVADFKASNNDSLVDTPTSYGTDTYVGGEVRGNYATLNPLDNGGVVLSNGNLDVSNGSAHEAVRATIKLPTTGKWYAEVTLSNFTSGSNVLAFGIDYSNATTPSSWQSGGHIYIGVNSNNLLINLNGSDVFSTSTTTSGAVLQVAYDSDAQKLWLGFNNTWRDSSYGTTGNPSTGTNPTSTSVTGGFLAVNSYEANASFNAGQRAFAYTAPSGFKALCDTNLPAPLTDKPNTLMDVALYTGNGSTQTISGLGFSPDFVWIKQRSGATSHTLHDTIRGTQLEIYSDSTSQEYSQPNGLTAFNSNGFTLGSQSYYNGNGLTFAAWCWDAGTSTVSNTQGSITSQVRANVSAGFSIGTWTGTASAGTIGHGLGVAPEFIIVKNRSVADSWYCYHKSLGNAARIQLNETSAQTTGSSQWNSTSPTSTVYSVGAGSWQASGNLIVSYCFAPVVGYSSFGSYTGNGSADGPFVYTGFRPRWVLFKRSDTSSAYSDWYIIDSARNIYNLGTNFLRANSSDPENYYNFSTGNAGTFPIDFLSNGFKYRLDNTGADVNANGGTYIYAAFAENPFQYARAR